MSEEFSAFREWDYLARPRDFPGPFDRPLILPGTDRFGLSRDADYNLHGEFTCTVEPDGSQRQSQQPWPSACDVSIQMLHGQIDLIGCALTTTTRNPKVQSGPKLDGISGSFALEEMRFTNTGSVDEELNLQEWCLNGVSAPGLFNRGCSGRTGQRQRTGSCGLHFGTPARNGW